MSPLRVCTRMLGKVMQINRKTEIFFISHLPRLPKNMKETAEMKESQAHYY